MSPTSPGPVLSVADQGRRTNLRRMKAVAAGLLGLAAVVYALTTGHDGWLGYVSATAEAAMVGAVADWFAVTALFRHPLGLPVPHTAIIPTRKDQLGRSLEEFVAANFLTEEVARDKVARVDVSRRIGGWLAHPGHAERVASEVGRLAGRLLRSLRDEDVAAAVDQAIVQPLLARRWSPAAGRLLAQVVEDGSHHRLVDLALEQVHEWLAGNRELIVRQALRRVPWWTPQWVDARVAARTYTEIVGFVAEVRAEPDHEARRALDRLLQRLADALQNDPATMAQAEALAEKLAAHPDVKASMAAIWVSARGLLVAAAEDPDSELRRRAVTGLASFGDRLVDDAALAARANAWVEEATGFVVRTYGSEISKVISETVARWDGKDAARRIELHVGRDLQFIRVNGTVVGGLVGLLIHTVTRAFA